MQSPQSPVSQLVSALRRPLVRDVLLLLLAVVLILSPVLATMNVFGGPEYRYESVEVIETDSGIAFADESDVPPGVPISDEIACSGTLVQRACALEAPLTDGGSQPLGVTTTDLEVDPGISDPPYRFVLLNGTLYRTTYETNESAQRADGSYPVEVTLSPSSSGVSLHAVSVPEGDVSGTIAEAARNGVATSKSAKDVPSTPVALQGNTYHRVFPVEEPSEGLTEVGQALFFVAAFGVILLISVSRKIRVNVDVDYQAER